MSATMAERVGTCILNELERHNCLPGSDLGERGSIAFDMAMAVIEAMREPTDEMTQDDSVAMYYWRSMIDIAIAEHDSPPPEAQLRQL